MSEVLTVAPANSTESGVVRSEGTLADGALYAASSFSRRVVPDIAIRRSRHGGKMRRLMDYRSDSISLQVP